MAKRVVKSGVVAPLGTVEVASFTQCLTDTFSVTSPGQNTPPSICGTNTGEHSKYKFLFFWPFESYNIHENIFEYHKKLSFFARKAFFLTNISNVRMRKLVNSN